MCGTRRFLNALPHSDPNSWPGAVLFNKGKYLTMSHWHYGSAVSTLPCQSPKHPKEDHEDAVGPGGEVFEKQLRSLGPFILEETEETLHSVISQEGKRRGKYSALLSHDH